MGKRKLEIDEESLAEITELATMLKSPEMKEAFDELDHLEKHDTIITGPVVAMKTDENTRSRLNFVRKPKDRYDRDSGVYSLAILVEIGRTKDMTFWDANQSIQYRPKLIYSNTKGKYIKVEGKNVYLNDSDGMLDYSYDEISDSEDMEQFECPREAFDRYLTYVRELEK